MSFIIKRFQFGKSEADNIWREMAICENENRLKKAEELAFNCMLRCTRIWQLSLEIIAHVKSENLATNFRQLNFKFVTQVKLINLK